MHRHLVDRDRLWRTPQIVMFFLISIFLTSSFAEDGEVATCPSYIFNTTTPLFSKLSPKRAYGLNSVVLPRDQRPLYRAIADESPQFDDEKVLRAMLGDRAAYVGTFDFDRISKVLTGELPNNKGLLGLERSEIYRSMKAKIEFALKCHEEFAPGTHYSYPEAQRLASDIMDSYFSKLSEQEIRDLYVNFKSGRYLDHSQGTLFSTVYQILTNWYGRRVLVFEDPTRRSIDLNFANHRLHGKWRHHPADVGEFIMPGYVRPDEITGYIVRTRSARYTTDVNVSIETAFFKVEVDGKPYVAIFEGADHRCIMRGETSDFYYCNPNFDRELPVPQFPIVDVESPAALMGVLTTCSEFERCELPLELRTMFSRLSTKEISSKYEDLISGMKINGKPAVYWSSKAFEAVKDPQFDLVQKKSGLCLSVKGEERVSFTQTQIEKCSEESQKGRWRLEPRRDGFFRIVDAKSNLCLDTNYGKTQNMTDVIIAKCHDGANMLWTFDSRGGFVHRILNKKSDRCLDSYKGGSAEGTRTIIADCNMAPNEHWTLKKRN